MERGMGAITPVSWRDSRRASTDLNQQLASPDTSAARERLNQQSCRLRIRRRGGGYTQSIASRSASKQQIAGLPRRRDLDCSVFTGRPFREDQVTHGHTPEQSID